MKLHFPGALLMVSALMFSGVESFANVQHAGDSIPGVRKLRDMIIYQDSSFHCAFPSVIKRRNGDLIVAFRRAPDRKVFGEKRTSHVDPNSFLVKVTSKDGINWAEEPELIYAHPFGGSQDPCLLQLRDGTILCSSYGWAFVRPDGLTNLKTPNFHIGNGVVFLGGYILISEDGGKSWDGPVYPPHIAPEVNYSAMGNPLPAYNRGAMYEGKSGRIFWVVAASDTSPEKKTSNHLLTSDDKGKTWTYAAPVAIDETASFNEASVYETPKGDLVAFLRTAGMDDQACIARSTDGGKSFHPWEKMGFQGHPLQAMRLPDDRVLLVYGYRHKPYGIRARILNAECTDFATAPEMVLREDGGTTDIGYPWAVMLDRRRVLVTYYFSVGEGPQHIAGTLLEVR
jgi:sialidase-1